MTKHSTCSPILLVHGGAWAIPDDMQEAHEQGVFNALQDGYRLLEQGGSAVDAVEAAVASLEDDPTFDAGRGSFLTRDGRVQLDALLMDGAAMRAGGVACVERIRNPIRAARLVMERSPHVYFVGHGAEAFTEANGMALIDPQELESLLSGSGAATNAAASAAEVATTPLTPRELEVLRMMADGAANKEIAWKLGISEHTVKFHVASILGKLDAGSRTEAVTRGLRSGLILI